MSSSKKRVSRASPPPAPPPPPPPLPTPPAVPPAPAQPAAKVGRAAKDQDYFKVYAPHSIRRQLHIEAMDAGRSVSTARYCLAILEERLPYDVRLSLQAQASREGRTVQSIILEALAKAGNEVAAAHVPEGKKKR